ncbi:protein ANTAGONIST OF LIKE HETEROCHROMATIN PROTEIN 1-like isoform X2 [Selaginella moellendorffii]|uniref:protein ANTAGONIST OF LIKE HETEROCHROMATIN PROTEIN 1-like isoform X2 n=1 Tax=Selaginella moellendorffii TaxID=88036 RepID=UPI000D1CEF3D|nr:protein ANTAGONIST OF LIKE HETEROCHROMATIN PROTEIN 1-like isoform X2 [Selaginella moellendorffii]|eukprot:XP_024531998.1 protein ANTAGONIST OF LIKE HETEROCHROMATIN PROTEIN 1-like isoform X2 [Selaginella moellendorffii]
MLLGRSTTRLDGESYYDRKQRYSVILQGVCDAQKRFLSVYAGWPGRVRVFRNSTLRNKIVARELLTSPAVLAYDDRIKPYLVGDKGYQLQQHLMIPHTTFNLHHHLAWIVIEQAFGLLKMKFRCLDQKQRIQPKYLPNIIKSCS